jgi:hypothetical protein
MKPLLTHPRGTPGRTAALYRIVRAVLRGIARSVYHLRVEGTENIPPQGGVILAANHVSALDPFVIGVAPSAISFRIGTIWYIKDAGRMRWIACTPPTIFRSLPDGYAPRRAKPLACLELTTIP